MDFLRVLDLVPEGIFVVLLLPPNVSLGALLDFISSDQTSSLGLWQQKFVKVMAIASFVAYVAVILTLFGHCTPIQKNWQIKPYAGSMLVFHPLHVLSSNCIDRQMYAHCCQLYHSSSFERSVGSLPLLSKPHSLTWNLVPTQEF